MSLEAGPACLREAQMGFSEVRCGQCFDVTAFCAILEVRAVRCK